MTTLAAATNKTGSFISMGNNQTFAMARRKKTTSDSGGGKATGKVVAKARGQQSQQQEKRRPTEDDTRLRELPPHVRGQRGGARPTVHDDLFHDSSEEDSERNLDDDVESDDEADDEPSGVSRKAENLEEENERLRKKIKKMQEVASKEGCDDKINSVQQTLLGMYVKETLFRKAKFVDHKKLNSGSNIMDLCFNSIGLKGDDRFKYSLHVKKLLRHYLSQRRNYVAQQLKKCVMGK